MHWSRMRFSRAGARGEALAWLEGHDVIGVLVSHSQILGIRKSVLRLIWNRANIACFVTLVGAIGVEKESAEMRSLQWSIQNMKELT